jgi:hypothetical protein
MHRLQELFASFTGEQSFDDRLQALFEANDFATAEALLADELATMDSRIANLCRELPREATALAGWEDLAEAIELNEGAPVTGVTLAIANDPDLAFEKGRLQEPFVTIELHTDEAYVFSTATPAELLAETRSEGPAWDGHEEDIELYLEASGFGPLNTALLDHDQRHFFREGDTAPAPMDYVDYVVGCWWRALRLQQAVAGGHAQLDVLGGIPLVAGLVDMRPQVACVFKSTTAPAARRPAAVDRTAEMRPELASILTPRPFAPLMATRTEPTVASDEPRSEGPSLLRQRTPVALTAPPAEEPVATAEETRPELVVEPAPPASAPELELTTDMADTAEDAQAELAAPVLDLDLELEAAEAPEAVEEMQAEVAATETLRELAPDTPEPIEEPQSEFASPLALRASTPAVEPDTETEAADEMRPAIVSLLAPDAPEPDPTESAEAAEAAADTAEISPAPPVASPPREEVRKAPTGTGLRRRLAETEFEADEPEKIGFLRRLFSRSRTYDEAA